MNPQCFWIFPKFVRRRDKERGSGKRPPRACLQWPTSSTKEIPKFTHSATGRKPTIQQEPGRVLLIFRPWQYWPGCPAVWKGRLRGRLVQERTPDSIIHQFPIGFLDISPTRPLPARRNHYDLFCVYRQAKVAYECNDVFKDLGWIIYGSFYDALNPFKREQLSLRDTHCRHGPATLCQSCGDFSPSIGLRAATPNDHVPWNLGAILFLKRALPLSHTDLSDTGRQNPNCRVRLSRQAARPS